jgi:hypothetical protein
MINFSVPMSNFSNVPLFSFVRKSSVKLTKFFLAVCSRSQTEICVPLAENIFIGRQISTDSTTINILFSVESEGKGLEKTMLSARLEA